MADTCSTCRHYKGNGVCRGDSWAGTVAKDGSGHCHSHHICDELNVKGASIYPMAPTLRKALEMACIDLARACGFPADAIRLKALLTYEHYLRKASASSMGPDYDDLMPLADARLEEGVTDNEG